MNKILSKPTNAREATRTRVIIGYSGYNRMTEEVTYRYTDVCIKSPADKKAILRAVRKRLEWRDATGKYCLEEHIVDSISGIWFLHDALTAAEIKKLVAGMHKKGKVGDAASTLARKKREYAKAQKEYKRAKGNACRVA